MKSLFRLLKWLSGIVLLLVVGLAVHTMYFRPLKIEWFFERVFAEYAFDDPELLTSLRMLPSWANWYGDDLTDRSPAREREMQAKLRADLATLREYDVDAMGDSTKLSRDVLEYFLQIQADGERFALHVHPLNPLFGVQNGYPDMLVTQHSIDGEGDARDYIARLRKAPAMAGQVLEGLAERERAGIVPPTFVVEKVLAEMRAFVAPAPRENLLHTSFAGKLGKLDGLAEADRDALLAEAETAIADAVYPAYGKWIAAYEALLPKTTGIAQTPWLPVVFGSSAS